MTTLLSAPTTGRRRRPVPPGYEEPVPQPPADPPIYRELLRRWAAEGRALPGHRDPEWSRLVSTRVWPTH
ncbi:hypothetical protein [Streptomyces sp. NPDC006879]|uniref:hypothetical protein n=1 Tax=Streptomyces sp. NPDC006879 TaxID=3364767 RepID=UPI003681EED4